jgi:hypothetical protein
MKIEGLRSPYAQLAGLYHLPRMMDKVRLAQAGRLPEGYNLGTGDGTCFDGRICRFFQLDYEAFRRLIESGASDEAVVAWVEVEAQDFTSERKLILNQFLSKRGYRDEGSAGLEAAKAAAGLAHRADIQTWFDAMVAEEE